MPALIVLAGGGNFGVSESPEQVVKKLSTAKSGVSDYVSFKTPDHRELFLSKPALDTVIAVFEPMTESPQNRSNLQVAQLRMNQ